MRIIAYCDTCSSQHTIEFNPIEGSGPAFSNWELKHPGHEIRYESPRRSQKDVQAADGYLHYLHNADVKPSYAASTELDMDLASLPASSSLLAGRQSVVINNTGATRYVNYKVAGHFKTVTGTVQAGVIQVGVVSSRDDTPNWPDVFTSAKGDRTITKEGIKNAVVVVGAQITVDNTVQTWPFGEFAIAQLFGDTMPTNCVIFVTHNAQSGANVLSATEGDHSIKITPTYLTIT